MTCIGNSTPHIKLRLRFEWPKNRLSASALSTQTFLTQRTQEQACTKWAAQTTAHQDFYNNRKPICYLWWEPARKDLSTPGLSAPSLPRLPKENGTLPTDMRPLGLHSMG